MYVQCRGKVTKTATEVFFSSVAAFVQGNRKARAGGLQHATHYVTYMKDLTARHRKLERPMDELLWAPKQQRQGFGNDSRRF